MASSAITGPVLADNKRAPSGTAAAPSFAFNASTGTGVYLVSSDVLGLSTAGVQRVVVDASGNVGIGATTNSAKLTIKNPSATGEQQIVNIQSAASTDAIAKVTFNQTTDVLNIANFTNTGALVFGTGGSGTERARIDASGNLLVGTTSSSAGAATVKMHIAGSEFGLGISVPTTGSQQNIRFVNGTTAVGSVVTNATNTTYNTNSDYRLKEDIKPMVAALSKVAALKPCIYKWKIDGSEGEGFIAHELAEVCPSAVSGKKDAVNEDGSIAPQGIDPSKLVGLLTAAIQELSAKNDALEARLAALEGK